MDYTITSWEEFLGKIKLETTRKTAYSQLSPEILADLFQLVENLDLRVCKIYMNGKVFTNIRKWGRDSFDMETSVEKVQQGIMGKIWGAEIIVQKAVPDKTVVAIHDDIPQDKSTAAMLILGEGPQSTIDLVQTLDNVDQIRNACLNACMELSNIIHKLIKENETCA